MSPQEQIERIWDEHVHVTKALHALAPDVEHVVRLIARAMAGGGSLLVCGNGGSAADAQHIAAELTGRFFRDRKPLPALALHANTSSLTAIANDYGYDEVFAREVGAHGREGTPVLILRLTQPAPAEAACEAKLIEPLRRIFLDAQCQHFRFPGGRR